VATSSAGRPGRALLVLLIIALAAGGWMVWKGVNTPRLGLDLQGGTTITLQPKPAPGEPAGSISNDAIDQAVEIISERVNGAGVAEAEVTSQGNGSNAVIVVAVPGLTQDKLVEQVGQVAKLGFRPVIDAQPNTPPTPAPSPSSSSTGGDQNKNNKNNKNGKENSDSSDNSNGALLPRVGAPGRAVDHSSESAKKDTASPTPTPNPTATATAPTGATPSPSPSGAGPSQELQQKYAALDCSDSKQQDVGQNYADDEYAIACDRDGLEKFLLGPVAVPGSDVDTAAANLSQNTAGWIVTLDFNSEGAKTFGQITQQMAAQQADTPGNRFAIVLDGTVVSAPGVNEAILGGKAEITGQFTKDEAQNLANVLKFGALPLDFTIVERSTVSPTLGEDQLHAGLLAGALGLALVVIYLLVYYRALALVAVASLVIAGGLTYAAVVILGETLNLTLTLAGVAGLIVAIGITADSFIVYFERIRDEVREGRSIRAALEAGWVRARRTIIAADLISLIAATVLWILSVGGVRGFAFTLGLTTVIDLVVVFLFTKPVISLLARLSFFSSGHPMSGLSPRRLGRKAAPLGEPSKSRRPVKEAT
jgi:preprotein translocase subunit SecD